MGAGQIETETLLEPSTWPALLALPPSLSMPLVPAFRRQARPAASLTVRQGIDDDCLIARDAYCR